MSDLNRLQAGAAAPPLTFGPISRTTLALYAGASADHNPIHIDTDYAKEAGMEDVFAHGMLSMAQLGRLLTDWVGIERIRSFEVRFSAMTHVGDTVSCTGEVVERFEENGETLLRVAVLAQVQTGAKTIVGEAVVRAS